MSKCLSLLNSCDGEDFICGKKFLNYLPQLIETAIQHVVIPFCFQQNYNIGLSSNGEVLEWPNRAAC